MGREGNLLGGWEVLPTETEGWADDKSKLFPLGHFRDCNQDAAPDKTLRFVPPPACSSM